MTRCVLFCLIIAVFPGCEWLNNLTVGKTDKPVFQPPPPRVAGNESRLPRDRSQHERYRNPGEIQPVSRVLDSSVVLPGTHIVATVNGQSILASDILDRYSARLDVIRKQATPEQYRTVQERLIKRDLDEHIKRILLVNALRDSLPKESLKKLDGFINDIFEKRVAELKKEFKVATRAELEAELAKRGTSLTTLRENFANGMMADQFRKEKTKTKIVIGRPEMMRYYNAHIADYKKPARVRWQEIQISYAKHGGKQAAFAVVEDVVRALKNRADFSEVARKYSDGTTAEQGGHWDWTRKGSLADKQIERALFELPVGDISQVYDGENAFKIVKIIAREPLRFVPFGDVQEDIRKKLEAEARRKNEQAVFAELRKNAVIWTMFDGTAKVAGVSEVTEERPGARQPILSNPFARR